MNETLQSVLIGGVIGGGFTVVSVIATSVLNYISEKKRFLLEKRMEIYPKSLDYIQLYILSDLAMKKARGLNTEQSNKEADDFKRELLQAEKDFLIPFMLIVPKKVYKNFITLKKEIAFSDALLPEKTLYKRLFDILKLN